ncbi:MAG: hypothetical protein M3Z22_00600, partial [Verrucomicrobiota bacterium]|nr:hypothetical protein [Verrucomicrobiota bacterium]
RSSLSTTFAALVALAPLTPLHAQQEPDKTAVMQEFARREENVEKLSIDDQLKIRAAQQKALETKEVKEALEKRDQAIVEFRAALRAAMVAADPAVGPILDRISAGGDPAVNLNH